MNIFGGPRLSPKEYHSKMHAVYKSFDAEDIGAEDANRLLLVTIGNYVENFEQLQSAYLSATVPRVNILDSWIKSFEVLNGRMPGKIEAIKEYRRISGMGLKESKEFIEEHYAHL